MSSLDQAVGFAPAIYKQSEDEVDRAIEKSLLMGSPEQAIHLGWGIIGQGHIRGLQLCKLLYELTEVWDSFNTDDDIKDAVFKGMGVPPETYRKYDGLWRNIFANPDVREDYKTRLRNKPLGGLMEVSVAVRDGEFDDDQMQRLIMAHDKRAMLAIRDEARGIERSDRPTVFWERSGQLTVFHNEEADSCGFLPHDGSELTRWAVDAIINSRVKIIER